ncbi:MAG: hypothetical protein IAF58_01355 [Leptolyngbya sp.]|nr:hypothetical protein [Candidatus Melainabacteria bacterium]
MNSINLESMLGGISKEGGTVTSALKKGFSALSLLAIFVASPVYATDPGTTLFHENFESGTLSSCKIVGNQTATVVRLSDCNRVGFFRLNKVSDAKFFSRGIPQTNSQTNLKVCNKAYRLQFRLYFPDMKRDHAEETIFTLAQKKVADDGGQGPISLCINDGQFVFKVAGKTVWCAPYCERRWYNFAIDTILETPKRHDASHGYVNLTVDGCPVSQTPGANVAAMGPYNTVYGISRPSWNEPVAHRSGLTNRQVYFDDLKTILNP